MHNKKKKIIWQTIKNFCCFKFVSDFNQCFCKNKFNLIGICSKKYCPLIDTNYATIIEKNGIFFLYFKVISNINFPTRTWKKLTLSRNFTKAIHQINTNLATWPRFFVSKLKLKLIKIVQILIRTKIKFIDTKQNFYQVIQKKTKGVQKMKIRQFLEMELLNRLHIGMYNKHYNLNFFQNLQNKIQQIKIAKNHSIAKKFYLNQILKDSQ